MEIQQTFILNAKKTSHLGLMFIVQKNNVVVTLPHPGEM